MTLLFTGLAAALGLALIVWVLATLAGGGRPSALRRAASGGF